MKLFVLLVITSLLNWMISCSGNHSRRDPSSPGSEKREAGVPDPSKKLIRLVSPGENEELKLNEGFRIVIEPENRMITPDSVKVWFDGREAGLITGTAAEQVVGAGLVTKTGRKSLKLVAYSAGSAAQTITRFLVVYSDLIPVRNSYRVVKEYPHDKGAFTQGLVYHGGVLYEGTGQESRSSLRKVSLETGQVLSQLNLESRLFGEGIAIVGERIFQLTWQSKVGFVYDLSTFRQLNRIYYQTEGWGLTAMNGKLVMSDGTNVLYILDPETFTVLSALEVYDNRSKVDQLNELEYINGEIWANIWQTDLIARIDPQSGKVIAYIDLKGLLKDKNTDTSVDVLNGIAWDEAAGRIFVTGKNWPKLFEIKIN